MNQNFQIDINAGELRFQQNNDAFSAAATRMTIEQNGEVGIGTENPSQRLDVVGNIELADRLIVGQGSSTWDWIDWV